MFSYQPFLWLVIDHFDDVPGEKLHVMRSYKREPVTIKDQEFLAEEGLSFVAWVPALSTLDRVALVRACIRMARKQNSSTNQSEVNDMAYAMGAASAMMTADDWDLVCFTADWPFDEYTPSPDWDGDY